MDNTQLTNLKNEIDSLTTFLIDYDTSVHDYLDGSNASCLHFLDVIDTLNNDTSVSIVYDSAWEGHSSSYGAMTNFVYEIAAIQRNKSILDTPKATYYTINDAQIVTDEGYNRGEASRTLAYILGTSPDQGIII